MSAADTLRLHQLGRQVRVLGPGTRFVVWVQGCGRRCPGCVNEAGQDPAGGFEMSVEALAQRILRVDGLDGLTISGGEPFLQAPALAALLDRVHRERPLGVIVYTGYLLEELQAEIVPGAGALLARTDLLIDGPYVEALNDDGSLRGSSNQRVIPLTDRYRDAVALYGLLGERETQLLATTQQMFLAGVPSRLTWAGIRKELEKQKRAGETDPD